MTLLIEKIKKMENIKETYPNIKIHDKKKPTLVVLFDESHLREFIHLTQTWRLISNLRNEYKREET